MIVRRALDARMRGDIAHVFAGGGALGIGTARRRRIDGYVTSHDTVVVLLVDRAVVGVELSAPHDQC